MKPLITRVKKPNENTFNGRVNMIRNGLKKAFNSPRISAAVIVVSQLSALTPAIVWTTTNNAIIFTNHVIKIALNFDL